MIIGRKVLEKWFTQDTPLDSPDDLRLILLDGAAVAPQNAFSM
jgi:hypothetical protein